MNPEITISTSSEKLAQELIALKIEGAEQYEPIRKCLDPEKLYHVVVEFGPGFVVGVAGNLFAAALIAAFKKHKPGTAKIDGKTINQNITQTQIQAVVVNIIHQHRTEEANHENGVDKQGV